MNLEKAKEILTKLEKTLAPTMAFSGIEAMELGIEALKQVQFLRSIPDGRVHNLLPGETEE